MFDHTVSKELGRMLNNLHERAHFHPLGLSATSRSPDNRLDNLSSIMRWLRHPRIDVLKIDCEGQQWSRKQTH